MKFVFCNKQKIKIFVILIGLIVTGLAVYGYEKGFFIKRGQAVFINEVCPKNLSVLCDSQEDYPGGWIELYNAEDYEISLKGWHLSDKRDSSYDTVLPDIRVGAKQYMLIYIDGRVPWGLEDGECYLDFKLNKGGQMLFLLNESGIVVDEVHLPEKMPIDVSYGRITEADKVYGGMTCTPWSTNADSEIVKIPTLEEPTFSFDSGFYEEGFLLELEADKEQRIYYTLDGSTPMPDTAELYVQPIAITDVSAEENVYSVRTDYSLLPYEIPGNSIEKATIVRAAAYDEDGNCSETVTKTYFVKETFSEENKGIYEIPVLSLVAEPEDIVGYEDGILVLGKTYDDYVTELGGEPERKDSYRISANFNQKGREWEREAQLFYFDNKEFVFEQTVGIRTRGKSSSEGSQKGLNVYARELYDGNANFTQDIFENDRVIKRFMLKNGTCLLKDGLVPQLVADKAVTTADYVPLSVFLNGEYWGSYAALEKYDWQFFRDYYGIERENLAIMKNATMEEGTLDDWEDFHDLFDFVEENDLSESDNYAEICSRIDIDSLIDYYCVQIYIDNIDCQETYNMLVWKGREPEKNNPHADGKWHWALYDIDASFKDVTRNNLTEEIREGMPPFFDHVLFGALLKNQDFRERFIGRFMQMMDENFAPEQVLPVYDETVQGLMGALKNQHIRFQNGTYEDGIVEKELADMRAFYKERRAYVVKYMSEYFEMSEEEMEALKDKNL